MNLLAFDTSTESMSVALSWAERTWAWDGEGGAQASARLIPQILHMLAEAGCTLADLNAIAFGQGPGAFTGLRTACSVAQGLAWATGKPVLALDSLLLVAQAMSGGYPDLPSAVWVVMDARMGEIYAACYAPYVVPQGLLQWQTIAAAALYAPHQLNERWAIQAPICVVGSALEVPTFAQALTHQHAWLPGEPASRAAALLPLALGAWQQGLTVDAAQARPVYVRNKIALTVAERRASRG